MRLMLSRAVLGLAVLACAAPARAEGPSSDAIVRALKPTSADAGATRGIRPIEPGRAAPPEVARSKANPGGMPSVSLNVDFASGSDSLRPGAMQTLDALGRALTNPELSAYRFRIDGHTDTVGPEDMNKALSERRAESVAHYLSEKFQVPAERMQVVGSGKDGLAVQTGDEVSEPRNRRVEVVNLGS